MSRLAITKAQSADELRRNKDKSRKTQAFLGESKKVQGSQFKGAETKQPSPERSMKQTVTSGPGATGGSAKSASSQSIFVDLLLFGNSNSMKKGLSMTQSFNQTMSSSAAVVNQVAPLRYILKNTPITRFEISYTNADGTRKTDTQMEEARAEAHGGKKKPSLGAKGKSNASKIQFLLD
jgi:hypothetical protein